jgi:amino acid transporter
VAFLAWRGLALSVKVLVGLGLTEMAIVFSLALSGFISPGPGGFNFSSWVPSHSLGAEGFALAVVFSLQGLTGWEAAAPLAEETSDPRRNVPKATMIAIIGLGVFLVLMYWGQIIGWGTNLLTGTSSHALVNAPALPGLIIAERVWGGGWVFVLAAMFSSTLAVCQACNNVSTRIWFKMGETGTLPAWFGKVHNEHKTPTNAIIANLILSLVVGLAVGAGFGADRSYFLSNGLVLVIAVTYIYISANVAVFFYYLLERRAEFNLMLHFILPIISSSLLVYVLIKSFQPYPAFPYDLAPIIDGVWFVVGIGILLYLWLSKKDQWIEKLGQAAVESDSIPTIAEDLPAGA